MKQSASRQFQANYYFLNFGSLIFIFLLLTTFNFLFPFGKSKELSYNQVLSQNINFAEFEKLTKELGVTKSYQLLKQRFSINNSEAHDFAHIIGIETYNQKGLSGLSICDTAYNYGCYHGFIEAYFGKNNLETIAKIEDICVSLEYVHTPSCLHGIGHGVMAQDGYKLETALSDCQKLLPQSQTYCFDGVFMERMSGSMQAAYSKPKVTATSLNFPCDKLAAVFQKQCYRNQVSLWLGFFQSNPNAVANHCFTLDIQFQDVCFESLGNLIVISNPNTSDFAAFCKLSEKQIANRCIIGIINELMFEGRNPSIAQNLCHIIEPKDQKECFENFGRLLNEYNLRFGKN